MEDIYIFSMAGVLLYKLITIQYGGLIWINCSNERKLK